MKQVACAEKSERKALVGFTIPTGVFRRGEGKAAALRTVIRFVRFIPLIVVAFPGPDVVEATQVVGFTAITVISGRFKKDDALKKSLIPESVEDDRRAKAWLSQQEPSSASDLYVQKNVWQPGGSTGWHTHPGRSFIIVTEGTVTEYEGPASDCRPHVYTKGKAFVDPHGDHVHIIRNESNAVARTTAIQLIAAGAARRIDVADPGNCRF
jgi:quercetin dioxygenase-like cupin family protein